MCVCARAVAATCTLAVSSAIRSTGSPSLLSSFAHVRTCFATSAYVVASLTSHRRPTIAASTYEPRSPSFMRVCTQRAARLRTHGNTARSHRKRCVGIRSLGGRSVPSRRKSLPTSYTHGRLFTFTRTAPKSSAAAEPMWALAAASAMAFAASPVWLGVNRKHTKPSCARREQQLSSIAPRSCVRSPRASPARHAVSNASSVDRLSLMMSTRSHDGSAARATTAPRYAWMAAISASATSMSGGMEAPHRPDAVAFDRYPDPLGPSHTP